MQVAGGGFPERLVEALEQALRGVEWEAAVGLLQGRPFERVLQIVSQKLAGKVSDSRPAYRHLTAVTSPRRRAAYFLLLLCPFTTRCNFEAAESAHRTSLYNIIKRTYDTGDKEQVRSF